MKAETKRKLKEYATIIFLSGDTKMLVAWLMFVAGFIIGAIIL